MEKRRKHKRGRMMRGRGGSLVLVLVLVWLWFWRICFERKVEKREGREGEYLFSFDTLHLVGLGLEGLGNLWRIPRIGNTS